VKSAITSVSIFRKECGLSRQKFQTQRPAFGKVILVEFVCYSIRGFPCSSAFAAQAFPIRPMCSFWLVEALTRAGLADAEKLDQAIKPGYRSNVCWIMPIISGFIQNRQDRKVRHRVISRRPLHISR
jgi:hypothetical protein